jgi:hypothetical protein
MSQSNQPEPEDQPQGQSHPVTQDFRHTPVAARVPEKVARGVFANAVMIIQTGDEFVLDFLSTIAQPQQVVSRVVVTAQVFGQLLVALRANVSRYEQQFGPLLPRMIPPRPPATAGPYKGQGQEHSPADPALQEEPQFAAHHEEHPQSRPAPPGIDELYQQWKLPDDMLGGVFANVAMIRHTPDEFCIDFIASFYPRPVVVSRVYLSATRVPSLIDAMSASLQKYQQRPPPST